ncbi:MAG: alpha/beta hydrolase fold domain-containing protein [Pikeienuella sp.]
MGERSADDTGAAGTAPAARHLPLGLDDGAGPSPFHPGAAAPETREFAERLEAMLAGLPDPRSIPIPEMRRLRASGQGIFLLQGPREGSSWVEASGPTGAGETVRLRLTPAPGPVQGTCLHIHGGGWTFNAPDQFDEPNQAMAQAVGCRVVSVRYRLAPETRWPAQLEDCLAAAIWALDTDPGPLVIMGESAGAHLAAATLLALKSADRLDRVAGSVLSYGMFDLRGTPSLRAWGPRFLVLSTPVVGWFVDNLMADGDRSDPMASPLLADLSDLPPALFQVGTLDPLLDDTLFMAARWRAAGGVARVEIAPGGVHGYDQFDLAIARDAQERRQAFVQERLAAAKSAGVC